MIELERERNDVVADDEDGVGVVGDDKDAMRVVSWIVEAAKEGMILAVP